MNSYSSRFRRKNRISSNKKDLDCLKRQLSILILFYSDVDTVSKDPNRNITLYYD